MIKQLIKRAGNKGKEKVLTLRNYIRANTQYEKPTIPDLLIALAIGVASILDWLYTRSK